jgi:hypothetical protein
MDMSLFYSLVVTGSTGLFWVGFSIYTTIQKEALEEARKCPKSTVVKPELTVGFILMLTGFCLWALTFFLLWQHCKSKQRIISQGLDYGYIRSRIDDSTINHTEPSYKLYWQHGPKVEGQ